MSLSQIAGKARFTVTQEGTSAADVWRVLTAPFDSNGNFWHPSYSMYEIDENDSRDRAIALELCGHAGGRYPLKVEARDDQRLHLRLWRGPSQNPPTDLFFRVMYRFTAPGEFLGLVYDLHVNAQSAASPVIDIKYREDWERQFFSRKPSFKNGPKREIEWIFGKFPIAGRLMPVQPLDPAQI